MQVNGAKVIGQLHLIQLWLFHGMKQNTWKTQNSYASPHWLSVWSPQTAYRWIKLIEPYMLVPLLLESLLLQKNWLWNVRN